MSIKGIDVARYQPTNPDPATTVAGIQFYIAKATEGLTSDPTYAAHITHAREHSIPLVAAYHFTDTRVSVTKQVDRFLSVAGDVDGYCFDYEGPNKFTKTEFVQARDIVHANGKLAGLYGSLSGYPEWGQDWNWIAYYSHVPPSHRWDIWQYGPAAAQVDGDLFRGTVDELRKLWSGTVTQLPITNRTPVLVTTGTPTTWYDLDGSVLEQGHGPMTNVYSPYEASKGTTKFRAVYGGPGIMLVHALAITAIPNVECQPLIDAAVTKAVADTKAAAHIVSHPDSVEF